MSKLFSISGTRLLFIGLALFMSMGFFMMLNSDFPNGGVIVEQENGESENEATSIQDYFQYRFDQMKNKKGKIPRNALIKALNKRNAMAASQAGRPEIAGIDNTSWTEAGPGNVGGRIRAVLPLSASTVFVGGVSGGIWKTTNCCTASTTWTAVDDWMANLAVSTLLVDPTNANVMYAGTGEGFNNADAVRGAGIFKSTNGGAAWTQLANTNNSNFYYVNRLAISPNGLYLLAATSTGIWYSNDGGTTWTQYLTGNWKDVRFDPTDSAKAVAGGTGFSWYSTTVGSTNNWVAATGLPATGRVELAYAPSSPSIVYASVDKNSGEVYKSTDGGQTYALVNSGKNYLGTQGYYDNAIWVNPTDATNVVVAGLDIYRSTDSGTNFTQISRWQSSWSLTEEAPSPHADHHALVSIPGSSVALLNGNDGGLYYTADISTAGTGANYNGGWVYLNNTLGITQFYGVAGNSNGVLYGGSQDNGVTKYTGSANGWVFAKGGDGGKSAVDPTDPTYLYNEYIYGKVNRSTGSGGLAEDIYGNYYNGSNWVCRAAPYRIDDACNGVGTFIAPIVLDPNNVNRLLVGGLSLWVSNDAKATNIYTSATSGPQWAAIKSSTGSDINAIAVAPGNSDVIWVGHKNSEIYMTTNGTSGTPTWTRVDTNIGVNNPGTMIGSIAIDKNDPNIVMVGFTGFGPNRLWRTTNGGSSWTNITNNLPAAPIYAVAINPLDSAWLYVGTEIGVFASIDTGASWNVPSGTGKNGDGPANVAVFDLQWLGGGNSYGSPTLILGTHGRGAWTADIIPPSVTNTYADASAVCGGNSPCYSTITAALSQVKNGGTVTVYAGTYSESITVNRNVTVNVVGNITVNDLSMYAGTTWNQSSSSIAVNNFKLFGGTWNANSSTLTVNNDWTGGGTFNYGTGTVVFAKNGVVTLSLPSQTEGTLSFCNLTINANTTVDTTDDFISAATGGSCTQYTQNGKLRREAPQQTVINFGAFTFKDARARNAVILQKQSGNSLWYTNLAITSNLSPETCNGNALPTAAVLRQFDLTASGGTAPYGPYTMRLYFSSSSPDESNGNTIAAPYALAIYHCNGTNWEKFSGTGGSDSNGVYIESTVTFSSGSAFAIGASGAMVYYSQGSSDAGALASWNSARNGSGSQPAAFTGSDTFIVQNGHSMTTATALTLSDTASLLEIESGGALTLNTNNVSVMGAQVDSGGTLTVSSGRTFTLNNGILATDLIVNGTFVNSETVTNNGSIAVNAGGVYQHEQNGGTIPTAAWDSASTLVLKGIGANVPGGRAQTFGNVNWNSTSQTTHALIGALTVNGNLTFTSTGSGSIILDQNSTVGGNLTMAGGMLHLAYTSTPTINVGGSVILSGGTLNAVWPFGGGTGIPILNVAGNWTYNSGTSNQNQGTVNFTKNGTATVNAPNTVGATLTFYNLTISSNTTVDVTDDFIATTGTLTDNGKLSRTTPSQTVTTGTFTFKDALNRNVLVLTKQSGGNLGTTSLTVTSNQTPSNLCGASYLQTSLVMRQFDLTASGGTAPYGPYTMRFYFSSSNPNEANGNTVSAPYNLGIYHCNGTSWEKFTGTGGSDANGIYVEATVTTSSMSPFVITQNNAPTDADLLTFDAKLRDDKVKLNWRTASELNIVGFNIWRATKRDGKFNKVNDKPIHAKTPGELIGNRYTRTLKKPTKAIFYKLEIVYADGSSQWSSVVKLK